MPSMKKAGEAGELRKLGELGSAETIYLAPWRQIKNAATIWIGGADFFVAGYDRVTSRWML